MILNFVRDSASMFAYATKSELMSQYFATLEYCGYMKP